MTEQQRKKCRAIIHAHAMAAAIGNLIPIPGLGIASDLFFMRLMTTKLCEIFENDSTEMHTKIQSIITFKSIMLKQPIKITTKELSKLIPGLGQIVAPSISLIMIEGTGWAFAKDLKEKLNIPLATNKTTPKSHSTGSCV